MFRVISGIRVSSQLLKNSCKVPILFFSSANVDESDDDFKPKSKVKDENPEEVLKFIDKVSKNDIGIMF